MARPNKKAVSALLLASTLALWPRPAVAGAALLGGERLAEMVRAWGAVGPLPDSVAPAAVPAAPAKAVDLAAHIDAASRDIQLSADGKVMVFLLDRSVYVQETADGVSRHLAWGQTARLARDGGAVLVGDGSSLRVYDSFIAVDTESGKSRFVGWGSSGMLAGGGTAALLRREDAFDVVDLATGRSRHLAWAKTAQLSFDGKTALVGDGRSFSIVDAQNGSTTMLDWGIDGFLAEDGKTALIGDGRTVRVYDVATRADAYLGWGEVVALSADAGKAVMRVNNGWIAVYDVPKPGRRQ